MRGPPSHHPHFSAIFPTKTIQRAIGAPPWPWKPPNPKCDATNGFFMVAHWDFTQMILK